MAFTPRLIAPSDFTTYYTERRLPAIDTGTPTGWQYFYSGPYTNKNYGAHTGNCTWYTMGRSAEIAGRNLYSEFRGSYEPYQWVNIWIGNPAQTSGPINYQLGDILIYHDHVEVVEKIEGNILTISYSVYSLSYPETLEAQQQYGCFFGTRTRSKMAFGDYASVSSEPGSRYRRNNGDYFYLSEALIGVIHNPYVQPAPTPTVPEIEILPESYNVTMTKTESYVDFTFTVQLSGIPANVQVSGGNSYPGLTRVYNTGWTYTDYTVSGVIYRRATKTQTLRYYREGSTGYQTVKHMYYDFTFSNGSIHSDTVMAINVIKKLPLQAILARARRERRRGYVSIK